MLMRGLCRVAQTRAAPSLLRSKPGLSSAIPRSPLFKTAQRLFVTRTLPRRGHGLEDYYDMPEYYTCMASPLASWGILGLIVFLLFATVGPLLHSNYYFTGRALPKVDGNTQLCDDSWGFTENCRDGFSTDLLQRSLYHREGVGNLHLLKTQGFGIRGDMEGLKTK